MAGCALGARADVTLHEFNGSAEVLPWVSSGDDMVGGTSHSSIVVSDEGVAVFSGALAKGTRVGFTSVRGQPLSTSLAGTDRLRLRVRGDGRSYMLRVTATGTPDRVHYRASFDTRAGEWMEVEVPYNAFKPFFGGYWVALGPLEPEDIRSIGFMFVHEDNLDFRLEIDWVRALSASPAITS